MNKKLWVVGILFCGLFLVGCQDKRHIADLQSLHSAIAVLQQQLISGVIDADVAEVQSLNLITTYQDLTHQEISDTMAPFFSILQQEKQELQRLGTLPVWATALGLSTPQGMKLQKILSKQITENGSGYATFTLVYKGSYEQAKQEAIRIARGAHLFLSPEILQAQKLLQQGHSVSGFDTKSILDSLVYTNHTLLDLNVPVLLSVSVDPQGLLTLEGTKNQK